MKNSLRDLNNHLFAELERLSDEDLKGEELTEEISRAKAIGSVAGRVIENSALTLSAAKFVDDHMNADLQLPSYLLGESKE